MALLSNSPNMPTMDQRALVAAARGGRNVIVQAVAGVPVLFEYTREGRFWSATTRQGQRLDLQLLVRAGMPPRVPEGPMVGVVYAAGEHVTHLGANSHAWGDAVLHTGYARVGGRWLGASEYAPYGLPPMVEGRTMLPGPLPDDDEGSTELLGAAVARVGARSVTVQWDGEEPVAVRWGSVWHTPTVRDTVWVPRADTTRSGSAHTYRLRGVLAWSQLTLLCDLDAAVGSSGKGPMRHVSIDDPRWVKAHSVGAGSRLTVMRRGGRPVVLDATPSPTPSLLPEVVQSPNSGAVPVSVDQDRAYAGLWGWRQRNIVHQARTLGWDLYHAVAGRLGRMGAVTVWDAARLLTVEGERVPALPAPETVAPSAGCLLAGFSDAGDREYRYSAANLRDLDGRYRTVGDMWADWEAAQSGRRGLVVRNVASDPLLAAAWQVMLKTATIR